MWHSVHIPKMQLRERIQGDAELLSFLFEYRFLQLFRKSLLALGYFIQALYLLPVYKTNEV